MTFFALLVVVRVFSASHDFLEFLELFKFVHKVVT